MALTDYASNVGQFIPPRNTSAQASPGAFRTTEYLDSTGNPTGETRREVLLYNGTGAAITFGPANDAGKFYMVDLSGVTTTQPRVIACAVSTPPKNVVVAVETVASATFGWFAYSGVVNCALHGTTDIAVGDYLKFTIATSAIAVLKDGTAETASSIAIAMIAQTTDGVTIPDPTNATPIINKVFLMGDKRTIA